MCSALWGSHPDPLLTMFLSLATPLYDHRTIVSIHALSLLEGLDTEKYLAYRVDFHKFSRCTKYRVHNDVMIIYFSESVGGSIIFDLWRVGLWHIFSKFTMWIYQFEFSKKGWIRSHPNPPLDLCMHTPFYSNGGTSPFINCLKVVHPNILLPREGAPSQTNSTKYLKTSKQFLFTTFHIS